MQPSTNPRLGTEVQSLEENSGTTWWPCNPTAQDMGLQIGCRVSLKKSMGSWNLRAVFTIFHSEPRQQPQLPTGNPLPNPFSFQLLPEASPEAATAATSPQIHFSDSQPTTCPTSAGDGPSSCESQFCCRATPVYPFWAPTETTYAPLVWARVEALILNPRT